MTYVPATLPTLPLSAPAPPRPREVGDLAALRRGVDAFMAEYLAGQRDGHAAFTVLYDDLAAFVCRPGKRLRPLLFLLAHRVFGGAPGVTRDLLAVGACLEFLHGFILVHDDIIDRAECRRGQPSLHRVIEGRLTAYSDRARVGGNLAIVLGDILFALAQKCLLESGLDPAMKVRLGTLVLGCMVETGFGEAADIIHGTRDVSKVSLPEIEQMYLLKTTRYTIECPLAMAAILAGAGPEELAAIARIAQPAGLAFQIQNDLREFARFEVSDAETPGDISEGKKTFLMRTAFALLHETDRGLLQLCFGNGPATEAKVSKARELIAKSGAIGRLTGVMDELLARAAREVEGSCFSPEVRVGLDGLIQMVRGIAQH